MSVSGYFRADPTGSDAPARSLCRGSVPVQLADFTRLSLIVPQLERSDAPGVLAELCDLMHREGCVDGVDGLYNAALKRERLRSTALSPGLAMPHGRLSDGREVCFALGRTAAPIHWFGADGEGVRVILLCAVPEQCAAEYLSLISAVARFSQDVRSWERLLAARHRDEILATLQSPLESHRAPTRWGRSPKEARR